MSTKTRGSPSLKSLKKQCSESTFKDHEQVYLVSSPDTQSTLASAILCRAILKSGGTFHVSFDAPIISLDRVSEFRTKHESASIIFVGIDTIGKKKIRKGKSYPLFVGGVSESDQVKSLTLGTKNTVPAAAYVFAEEQLTSSDYELQISAGAILLHSGAAKQSPKANKEIVEQAKEKKLVEESHRLGLPYAIHICGNTGLILEKMVRNGADAFELDYKTDTRLAFNVLHDKAVFIGNVDPSGVLAMGTPALVREKTESLLKIFSKTNRFILNAGCAIPANTPEENIREMIITAKEYKR